MCLYRNGATSFGLEYPQKGRLVVVISLSESVWRCESGKRRSVWTNGQSVDEYDWIHRDKRDKLIPPTAHVHLFSLRTPVRAHITH